MESRSTEQHRNRHKSLVHKFLGIASRAALSEECSMLVDSVLDSLSKQVDDKAPANLCQAQADTEPPNASLHTAKLKKKETQKRGSRQTRSWTEKGRPKKIRKEPTKV
jgi:hypothetical protein